MALAAPPTRRSGGARLLLLGGAAAVVAAGVGLVAVAALETTPSGTPCALSAGGIALTATGADGGGRAVGATEYGGPGDPSSGTVGASGADLVEHPDSYAELGGVTFQTATAMGGLPYMTPLRVTWDGRSAVAYKRDFGLGGGPVDGLPRVIDLWWQFAAALRIPYESGRWSGAVRVSRPPTAGAAGVLAQAAAPSAGLPASAASTAGAEGGAAACTGAASSSAAGVPLSAGPRAELLPSGQASAPAAAPAAVKGIIAAGNQIVGKPYLVGGGHGVSLGAVASAYDCSSSVEHLLYGGGLLPAGYDAASGTLESFGRPGPGRWVTIFASADHVFMYVAGLRWDTHDAAGPGDGSAGIGWHPLVRESAGFVVRHPVGL
jgi:cell wall-associated NlpC family hydrolase